MTFNLFGIKIEINFLFFCLLTAFVIIESSKVFVWGLSSALIHELGHIIIMILVGHKPSKIAFNLFDIAIKDDKRNRRNYREDIFILLGGPIANFIMGVILWWLYIRCKNQNVMVLLTENLFLGIFNVLPIESLDGGQILYICLSSKLPQNKAIMALELISFAILLPLAILGFYILLISKYNYSLLFISCYLMGIILIKKGHYF